MLVMYEAPARSLVTSYPARKMHIMSSTRLAQHTTHSYSHYTQPWTYLAKFLVVENKTRRANKAEASWAESTTPWAVARKANKTRVRALILVQSHSIDKLGFLDFLDKGP